MISQLEEGEGKGKFSLRHAFVISEGRSPCSPIGNGGTQLGWLPTLQQQPRVGSAGTGAMEERGPKGATLGGPRWWGPWESGEELGRGEQPLRLFSPERGSWFRALEAILTTGCRGQEESWGSLLSSSPNSCLLLPLKKKQDKTKKPNATPRDAPVPLRTEAKPPAQHPSHRVSPSPALPLLPPLPTPRQGTFAEQLSRSLGTS